MLQGCCSTVFLPWLFLMRNLLSFSVLFFRKCLFSPCLRLLSQRPLHHGFGQFDNDVLSDGLTQVSCAWSSLSFLGGPSWSLSSNLETISAIISSNASWCLLPLSSPSGIPITRISGNLELPYGSLMCLSFFIAFSPVPFRLFLLLWFQVS